MSYNHHGNFIADPSTDAAFNRILVAIDADLICFQEFPSSVSQGQIAARLNTIMPIGGAGWQIHLGLLGGTRTVIASRYPLLLKRVDTIPPASTRGVTLALADLPDADYAKDIYLLGVHLKCCGDPGGTEDQNRQDSADAIANWLGDARGVVRRSGNNITLPVDTPMIALGDFNLVGGPQPAATLVDGDIQDEPFYGPDVKGDWDVSDMTDLTPVDPFTGDIITWQGSVSFPPGRLDRMFYTDSATTVAGSFILNTDTMTPAALAAAGLHATDTLPSSTSDHLPIVMDVRMSCAVDADQDGTPDCSDGCPSDPLKTTPGACGCGAPDTDSDFDGAADCIDPCPTDNPNDTDADGVCDSADVCPGFDDTADADDDAVPDACDNCPAAYNPGQGVFGDANGDSAVDLQDILCVLDGFAGRFVKCSLSSVDLAPCGGDGAVDLLDILAVLDAYESGALCCAG